MIPAESFIEASRERGFGLYTGGRLNDLCELSRMAKRVDCQLLIDAVSSFGAEESTS